MEKIAHMQHEIYNKFYNGDPITDAELAAAKTYWANLQNELSKVGPVFELARKEAIRIHTQIVNYQTARAEQAHQDDLNSESYKEGFQVGLTWDANWTPGGPYVWAPSSKYVGQGLTNQQIVEYEERKAHARRWQMGWQAGNAVNPNKPITRKK